MNFRAFIVAVGTELTSGQTVDTNSVYIAGRLAEAGIVTVGHYVVDDHQERIAEALRLGARSAEVVIVSGGLGPTADDLTRQAFAESLGTNLAVDEASLAKIEEFFRVRGRAMNESNKIQAMTPRGTDTLENPVGTAPGLHGRLDGAEVFVVPGVPSEMRQMMERQVMPRLVEKAGEKRPIRFRAVHTFGMGESDVGALLHDMMGREMNPLVGTTVAGGVVSVRVTARDEGCRSADELAELAVEEIGRRVGKYVFGYDGATMAEVVGRRLRERGETVGVAESCTGGMLGTMITEASGASAYFIGGVVSYSNDVKQRLAGVPEELLAKHGAVSEEVSRSLAEGARRLLRCDWGLGITGIAGPTGGTENKPVGLVYVSVAGREGSKVERHIFSGDRGIIRLRSAMAALNLLRIETGG